MCRAKLLSRSDAEDATQETFVRGFSGLGRLQSDAAIGGWLRQIARNVCVDMIRRNAVRRSKSIDHIEPPVGVDEHIEIPGEENRLMRFVCALPEPQREIIMLHYYENMTYDEIAQWLGVARSTVNDRLSKARQTLRTQLSAAEYSS